jgi:hypothetical protein
MRPFSHPVSPIEMLSSMKRLLTLMLMSGIGHSNAAAPSGNPFSRTDHPGNSVRFWENKGQVFGYDGRYHPEVKYNISFGATSFYITNTGFSYQVSKVIRSRDDDQRKTRSQVIKEKNEANAPVVETFRMDMTLVGANESPRIEAEGKSIDYLNFYTHNVTGVHSYSRIVLYEVYPGIDWVLTGRSTHFKSEFIVHPFADPSLIRARFSGQERLTLTQDGGFEAQSKYGSFGEKAPVSFQGDKSVATEFDIDGDVVSYRLADYDRSSELVIDPEAIWLTYFGQFDNDIALSCAVDQLGNLFVAGHTSNIGMAMSGHQTNYGGGSFDAILSKYDVAGTRIWTTYYGGSLDDEGFGCAVDQTTGNVYLCGATNSPNNIGAGGYKNFLGASRGAFLVKFNPSGSRLWGTYYGGSTYTEGYSCAVDLNGDVFLAGVTDSPSGVASGGHQNTYGGGFFDQFLVKFSSTGSRLWATYYGGPGDEEGINRRFTIATDGGGNVFMSGSTESATGIASGGHQNSLGGGSSPDGFLVKFNGNGVRQWATYCGGNSVDFAWSCATDGFGSVYLAGSAASANGIAFQGHQMTHTGMAMPYVVKYDANGARQWGTYLGTNGEAMSVAVDLSNNVYVVGIGQMTNTNGYVSGQPCGSFDGFMVKLDAACSLVWGSNLCGGLSGDELWGCAVDGSTGDLFICGNTTGQGLAVSGQTVNGGAVDHLVGRFCTDPSPDPPVSITGDSVLCPGMSSAYTVQTNGPVNGIQWKVSSSTVAIANTSTVHVFTPSTLGFHHLSAQIIGTCGKSQPVSFPVIVATPPSVNVDLMDNPYCAGNAGTLVASGADTYLWPDGSGGNTHMIVIPNPTTYTVIGTSTFVGQNAACAGSAVITVNPINPSAFSYTLNGMELNLKIHSGCTSFVWDFGNGTGSSINPNPVVTYNTNGTYGVCLRCDGFPSGCTRCVNFKVPGNMIGGVGVEEIANSVGLKIGPNPFVSEFVIEVTGETFVSVFNATGQLVLSKSISSGRSAIDIGNVSDGIYVITLSDPRFGMRSVKLVRQSN